MTDEEYRRTAKALARETRMADSSAARIEEAILGAIDRRDGAVSQRSLWLPPWLAAAAALVLIAGTLSLWMVTRTKVNSAAVTNQVASKTPSVPHDVTPHVAVKPPVVRAADVPRTRRATRPVQRSEAGVVRPSGFVELPWTAGLPAFESGEIVRMEVPAATLPGYGIDISSGTGNGPVAADVLIGQDGFARAIRLVTSTARSTQ